MEKYIVGYNQVKQIEIEAETEEEARELFLSGEFDENETENLGIDFENYDIKINK